jgi:hypothetical protein
LAEQSGHDAAEERLIEMDVEAALTDEHGFPKRERSGALRFDAGPDGGIVIMAVRKINQRFQAKQWLGCRALYEGFGPDWCASGRGEGLGNGATSEIS